MFYLHIWLAFVNFSPFVCKQQMIRPRDFETFFMLNPAEHEFYLDHKCENAKHCWYFNID